MNERVTVAGALPSVTVTSSIEAVGETSSSVIVAAALRVGSERAVFHGRQVDEELLDTGFRRPVPVDVDEMVPVVLPGLIVIAVRASPDSHRELFSVRRRAADDHGLPLGPDSETGKFAATVPEFPSVTVASPICADGGMSPPPVIVPAAVSVPVASFETLRTNVSSSRREHPVPAAM